MNRVVWLASQEEYFSQLNDSSTGSGMLQHSIASQRELPLNIASLCIGLIHKQYALAPHLLAGFSDLLNCTHHGNGKAAIR